MPRPVKVATPARAAFDVDPNRVPPKPLVNATLTVPANVVRASGTGSRSYDGHRCRSDNSLHRQRLDS
jgi:hypothetical protein